MEERHILDLPASKTHPLKIKDIKAKRVIPETGDDVKLCPLPLERALYWAERARFFWGDF